MPLTPTQHINKPSPSKYHLIYLNAPSQTHPPVDWQSIDEGVVLTELEDAFLTSAAYNKQPEMLKYLAIDANVIHVRMNQPLLHTLPPHHFSHTNVPYVHTNSLFYE